MLPKLCYVTVSVKQFHNSEPRKYCERVYASSKDEISAIVQERQRHAYAHYIDRIEGLAI